MTNKYKLIVGIEVHCELKTNSKIYCSCSTKQSKIPNTNVCPICMGFPGTLPTLNKEVVNLAIKAGLATNCSINKFSKQDRKNYFYPDLPKAFQISQFDYPLCYDGYITIDEFSNPKKIGIERIHIEEDAGKLIHLENEGSLIDFNRSGVGLIEIVSKPDIQNSSEAKEYLQNLRNILVYANISDCQMNLGQFRCDVNISVVDKKTNKNYNKVEIKNVNSFNYVAKAIDYEFERQVNLIEKGLEISQETRRFDSNKNITTLMRKKETSQDYMYFQEPNIPYINIDQELIDKIKNSIPTLASDKIRSYLNDYNLSLYDSKLLVNEPKVSNYFDEIIKLGADPKITSNLILGEIFSIISKNPMDIIEIPINPKSFFTLTKYLENNTISFSAAKQLLNRLWENDFDVKEVIKNENLEQITDANFIKNQLIILVKENPEAVEKYKQGKKRAIQAIIGQLMKKTKGKADPKIANKLLLEIIKEM